MRLKTIFFTFLLAFAGKGGAWSQELLQLHKYDETNSQLEGHTTQILQDRNGFLWIATWNGIYRFDGYEFQSIKPTLSDTCTMTSDRIRDIWLAKDGNIYVRNDERLFHFDISTYHFRNLRDEAEQTAAEQQRDDQPTRGRLHEGTLEYIDPQGLLWKFHKDALFCMRREESPAKPLPMEQPAMVSATMLDSHKHTWVGTKEDCTLRLLGSDGQLIGYMGPDGTLAPAYRTFGHAPYVITETSDKHIWIGTKPDGLFRLTQLSSAGEKPRYRVEAIGGLANTAVYDITEDRVGRLWIATLGGGISVVNDPGAPVPTIANNLPGYPDSLCQRVRHIHINKKGILLAATTEGLIVAPVEHDVQKMQFVRHYKDPDRATSLSCNATMDIVETAEGSIFICTETGGVNKIASANLLADTLSFRHYDIASGSLPTDMTIGMTVMPNGHLFITSNMRLIILDVVDGQFESLTSHFFHHEYKFSQANPLLMPNGQWLIGCLDGAFTLPTSTAHPNNYRPPLLITSITFANRKPLLAVTQTDTLRLKPAERSLTIHFAALDYVAPQAISYQYRLGADTTGVWNNLGHSHSVTLLDLTPGTYNLSVQSTNADGVWTENTRTLTIVVEPRLWETTWFRLLMALVLTAAVAAVLFTIYYIRRLKGKQRDALAKYLQLLEHANRQRLNAAAVGTPLPPAESADDPFMQRVLLFVEKNLSDSSADISAMAEACAVSRSVLQRKMKQLVGLTPNDFMREARMKHACQLLRSTDIPVSDVAYRCGYNDPKYFSRCFRQSTGMTPTEYKNQ